MKRILSFLLALLLCAGMLIPGKVAAADAGSHAGAVTTSGGSLHVRKSPSTGAAVVATLRKGSYITLLSRSGSWWRVEYGNGLSGYCHADYITPVQGSPVTVRTNGGSLNVRTGPGTSHTKIASLYQGQTVLLLSASGDWSRVLYHGTKTGYVSSRYLSGTQSGGGAVSLRVPSFKQTDPRWANVTIGASGKTMAKIGCATTAIAMMESYRTGTTIYPDDMSKKLTYTSSGNVYWPSYYVAVTDSTGYLSAVYEQLKEGRPVLFGAKNAYGSQHWVVITGFHGGSLAPENFSIQDPGSNTRTTLGQFLAQYPTFYKYFCYN